MLGIDARAARAAWTVLLIALAVVLVYLIRRTILIFTIAVLLAYLLSPLVNLLDRVTPRRFPRALSLAVVYLLLIAVVISGGGALGSRIVDEASQLAGRVPEWLQAGDLVSRLPVPAWLDPWKVKLLDEIRTQLQANAKEMVPLLQKVGRQVISLVGNLGFVVLVPILSFFFLKDGPSIRGRVLRELAESPARTLVEDILSDVNILLGQFMRALVILSAATFVFYGSFFLLIGVPYAALLAGLAGTLEFIPVLGPLSASVVIILVTAFSGHTALVLWLLIFLLAYRVFQDYVLQPYLMSSGVELHPLWIIFGVLAGEQIAGVAGMFLSIPVLAIARVLIVRVQKAGEARRAPSTAV